MFVVKKSYRTILLCALLAVVTLAAYWPVTRCGFINFDGPMSVND